MKQFNLAGVYLFALLLLTGCGRNINKSDSEGNGSIPRQLVFVGDTERHVDEMLGEPSIEFPEGKCLVRWYAGYEVVLSNRVAVSVKLKPVESEEEKLEK